MFKTKEEYLKWRSQWQADYAALSDRIRDKKAARKNGTIAERCTAQVWCHLLRKEATAMLEERKESKVKAQQSYLSILRKI